MMERFLLLIITLHLFLSPLHCVDTKLKETTPGHSLKGHATMKGALHEHDWTNFGDDWEGSATLDDGSHNPNVIKGWGSASASAWTQPSGGREGGDDDMPQPQDQQQQQMPQQGSTNYGYQQPQQNYGSYPGSTGSTGYGYTSSGFGYQQPSSGYGTGYSSGYGYDQNAGYASSGFGYQQPATGTGYSSGYGYDQSAGFGYQQPSTGYSSGYSTGYGSTGYGYDQSSSYMGMTGSASTGQMPGGQKPMGAPGQQQPQQQQSMSLGMPGATKKPPIPGGQSMAMGVGVSAGGAVSGKCPLPHRHRKPWFMLTIEQKDMFIDGFQQIRKNGKLDVIAQTHGQHDLQSYVHYTSLFAFYNAYLVWEVENAIRDLGGKFACFTMPYYDWTLDAGLEDDPTILHSGVGGDGDADNDLCVTDDETGFSWKTCRDVSKWKSVESTGSTQDTANAENDDAPYGAGEADDEGEEADIASLSDGGITYSTYDDNVFSLKAHYFDYGGAYDVFDFKEADEAAQKERDEVNDDGFAIHDEDLQDDELKMDAEYVDEQYCYWTQANCKKGENAPFCCLKRKKSSTTLLPTAAQIGDAMYRSKNIKEWQGYLNEWFNQVMALYGSDYYAHMSNAYASEDPIFWLSTSFLVHLFSLWQDCWNYNNIPKDKLDMHYNSYHPYCGTFDAQPDNCPAYNLALDAPMNFYELQKADWSMANHKIITVRKMWTPDFWNVVYELGPFYTTSGVNNWCDNTRDSEWFITTMDYDPDFVNTDVNVFSQTLREQMYKDGMEQSGVFKTVAALSCRYSRKYSKNSCWTEDLEDERLFIETCDEDEIDNEALSEQTLDDFLAMDGVESDECLQQIRSDVFPYSENSIQVKKQLCKGDWDYRCPEYNELLYGQYASFLDNPVTQEAKERHSSFFARSGWIWMIVINGILVILVALGCGIWHCSRSKRAKIPDELQQSERGGVDVLIEEDDEMNDGSNSNYGTIQPSQDTEEYQPLLV